MSKSAMAEWHAVHLPKLDTWVDRLTLNPSRLNESPKKNDDN